MNKWAGTAIIAKAKSMYGNRLTSVDYKELIKKTSIQDVTIYLKNTPEYKDALVDVQDSTIHRGQLEEIIKKTNFLSLFRLMKFLPGADQKFYEINLVKREIEVILAMVRSIISGSFEAAYAEFPVYFMQHASFDIERSSRSKTMAELLNSLSGTPYHQILSVYENLKDNELDYSVIEQALDQYYFDTIFKRIHKYYSGTLERNLKHIFMTGIELMNIIKIYRLKKFYNAPKSQIQKVLITKYSRINSQRLEEMMDLPDADEILQYLQKSEFSKYADEDDYIYIEYYADRLRYYLAKRYMYYSTDAPIVFAAYMLLTEIERQNLINIIEGIRYGLDPREIESMIIY